MNCLNLEKIDKLSALCSALPEHLRIELKQIALDKPVIQNIPLWRWKDAHTAFAQRINKEVDVLLGLVDQNHVAYRAWLLWNELVEISRYQWEEVSDGVREARRSLNWRLQELGKHRLLRIDQECKFAEETKEGLIELECKQIEDLMRSFICVIRRHEEEKSGQFELISTP